jgi:hypothetical protein
MVSEPRISNMGLGADNIGREHPPESMIVGQKGALLRAIILSTIFIRAGEFATSICPANLAKIPGVCAILGEKNVMGFPIVPRATRPSPVFFVPQWSAHFPMVTEVSLQEMPRR